MKKKCIAAIALAAILSVQPLTAFAALSPPGGGGSASHSGGSGGGSSSGTVPGHSNSGKAPNTVTVSASGVKTTGATTSQSVTGSTIGVAVDTVTTTGQPVTVNPKGEAVVGNVAIGFANSGAATAGLPANVVAAIGEINAGKPLSEAIQGLDMNGYNALTETHAIITKDAATEAVKDTPVEVSLYVPNLVAGLSNVQILFYNNATGQWLLLPSLKIDPVSKTVAVNIPGSGTLSVVYKK